MAKQSKIIENLQLFVTSSPSIKTVLKKNINIPKKTSNDFIKRNIYESNNKLHIRERYPYDEFKIDRNPPRDNLNNGMMLKFNL